MDISPDILKRSIESLLRLQEIDGQLFALNREETTPPPEFAEVQAQLQEVQRAVKSAERNFRDIERERRAVELSSLTLEEDLRKAESRRREMRNTKDEFAANRDYEGLQKRSLDLKKSLEDKTGQVASKTQAVEDKKKLAQELEERFKQLEANRVERIKQIASEKQRLTTQRDEYISHVDDDVFSLYERVQKIRKGNGIAIVRGSVCSGCHVAIPPQLRSRVEKMQEVITCSSCSRILYPEDSNGEAAA